MGILARQYGANWRFSTEWNRQSGLIENPAAGVFSDELQSTSLFVGVREEGVVWYPESLADAAARFLRLPVEQRARIGIIYGKHIEYGFHERVHEPILYFTLLRRPVERVLSHYDYASQPRQLPEGMSRFDHISTFVESNLQTRMLAGLPGPPHGTISEAEMLERAIHNLRSCAVVGLTERFDETILIARKAFDWRMPFYTRLNTNKIRAPKEALPGEVLRQVEAANCLDAALYEEAQKIFEAQIRAYGPALKRDLIVFRLWNAIWQRWHALEGALLEARENLRKRGVLSRWLPARFRPRVVSSIEGDRMYFDLMIGKRLAGHYDIHQRRWEILPQYRWWVDVRSLPGEAASDPVQALLDLRKAVRLKID